MITIIEKTLHLLITNWQRLLVAILPLFLLDISPISPYFKPLILFLVGLYTNFYLYLYLLRPKDLHLLKSGKLLGKFTLISLAVPAGFFLIVLAAQKLNFFYMNYAVIYFIGFYFLTRFTTIIPMVICEENLTTKNLLKRTRSSYIEWMVAATILYLPFVLVKIYLPEGIAAQLIAMIQLPWLACFYTVYFTRR